jgi:hypothetical protein
VNAVWTESEERPDVEGWTDDRERVVSVADVTHILTGQAVGEAGPRSTCTICDARLEAGDMVAIEAVKQDGWNEWVPRLLKCTGCCREELTLEHGYFHQVLVKAMLLYTENTATETAYHTVTNVSLVSFNPQGDGYYVDPGTFDEEIQLRLRTSGL